MNRLRRHPLVVLFAAIDTATTLASATWWPRHPGTLAWFLLGVQALACLSPVARRRTPLTVVSRRAPRSAHGWPGRCTASSRTA